MSFLCAYYICIERGQKVNFLTQLNSEGIKMIDTKTNLHQSCTLNIVLNNQRSHVFSNYDIFTYFNAIFKCKFYQNFSFQHKIDSTVKKGIRC